MNTWIVRYAVKVGSRTVYFWIRPEGTENRTRFATHFPSSELAIKHVADLSIQNIVEIKAWEVS